MHIKENDQIPNADVFVMENGEPVKKNTQIFLRIKK
jgi:peroxiredoxin (alkyl hydroperoxide reductase subunit C)